MDNENITECRKSLVDDDKGYDLGPDTVYLDEPYRQTLIPIKMISGTRETDTGEMIIDYEQVFVKRSPHGIFYEPQDETPTDKTLHTSRKIYYYDEKIRLSTFVNKWRDDYHVRPEDLARNGFIFAGPADRVKCVFCLKFLRNWDVGDTVEGEHKRHCPDCPFVLGEANHLNITIPENNSELLG